MGAKSLVYTSKVQAIVFLKQLAIGNYITLYNHIDENKTRYFIAEANATPVELKYYQYYNDQHDAVERTFFRGQLIFYINKYAPANIGLTSTAEKEAFDEVPLVSLVNKINGNKGGNVNGMHKKSSVRFFVGSGGVYTQTKFEEPYFAVATNSGSYYYDIKSSSVCIAPQVNFGFDLFINPNVQKLIFRTAVTLTSVSAQLSYPVTLTKNNQLNFDEHIANITPQLLYNMYNKDSFKVYIDVGVSANFISYSNLAFTDPATGQIDPNIDTDRFNNFVVSFPLQAGIVLNKRFEAAFTYTPYAKITSYSQLDVRNQSFGLGLKYLLGSK